MAVFNAIQITLAILIAPWLVKIAMLYAALFLPLQLLLFAFACLWLVGIVFIVDCVYRKLKKP